MSTGTCDEYKKFVCPKKYFQKSNFKYEILNHLYFGPNFFFWGTALGHFSQCFFCFFSNFRRRLAMAAEIFTQSPTIKKLPTTLFNQNYNNHGKSFKKEASNKET